MTVKKDAKYEEKLTCQFKIDRRNLTNFDPSIRKTQKFNGLLWTKFITFELKKVQRSYF